MGNLASIPLSAKNYTRK